MPQLIIAKNIGEALAALSELKPIVVNLFEQRVIPTKRPPVAHQGEMLRFYQEFGEVYKLLEKESPQLTLKDFRARNAQDDVIHKKFSHMLEVINGIQVHNKPYTTPLVDDKNPRGFGNDPYEMSDEYHQAMCAVGTILAQIDTQTKCPFTCYTLDELDSDIQLQNKTLLFCPNGVFYVYEKLQEQIRFFPMDPGLLNEKGWLNKYNAVIGNIYNFLIKKYHQEQLTAIGILIPEDIFRFIDVTKNALFSVEEIELIVQMTLRQFELNQQNAENTVTAYLHYDPRATQQIMEERDIEAAVIAAEEAERAQRGNNGPNQQEQGIFPQDITRLRRIIVSRIIHLIPEFFTVPADDLERNRSLLVDAVMGMSNILPRTLLSGTALYGTREQQQEIMKRIAIIGLLLTKNEIENIYEELKALLDPNLNNAEFQRRLALCLDQVPIYTLGNILGLPFNLGSEISSLVIDPAKKLYLKLKEIEPYWFGLAEIIEKIPQDLLPNLAHAVQDNGEQQKKVVRRIKEIIKIGKPTEEELRDLYGTIDTDEAFSQNFARIFIARIMAKKTDIFDIMLRIKNLPSDLAEKISENYAALRLYSV